MVDYKGFCLHVKEWDRFGIPYGLNELIEIAEKYNTPIPIDIQLRFHYFKVLDRIAKMWRNAENYYLETGSGWQKDKMYKIQKSLNLNEWQTKEIEEICYSMGV
jgi:hypothetical protein